MTTTTDKISYAINTGTLTLTQPASSSTAGQGSTSVDNTGSLYVNALVFAVATGGTIASTGDKTEYLFAFGGPAAASVNISTQEMANPGTNAAIGTFDVPTNLLGPIPMEVAQTGTVSKTFNCTFPMSQFFGGVLPPFWGIAARNSYGATGTLTVTYTGITYTNG